MAYFKVDAELMTNYVAATPVPAGSHFATVLDETSQPIVISLSSDRPSPKLQIVRHNENGVQYLFDLGACFNLPTDALIQTFDVVQDSYLTLYIVFAYLRDGNCSHVVLSKPFAPSTLRAGVKLDKIPGDWTVGTVERIFMIINRPGQFKYPEISTSWGKDITLAILDQYLTGIFVLYKTSSGELKCYGEFTKPDDQSSSGNIFQWATDVQCPRGATCISAIRDKRSASALIFGSPAGLSYLDSASAVDKKITHVLISDDNKVHGRKTLEVAQDTDVLPIWFTSNSDQLGHIRTNVSDVTARQIPDPVLLLPAGQSTSFAPAISRTVIFDNDVVCHFYSSDDAIKYEVKSYSITLKAFNDDDSPVPNASVQVSSASAITGILNGSAVTLSSTGYWYLVDSQGMLNFIVLTESIASQVLTISGIKNSKDDILKADQVVFDLSRNPIDSLGAKLDSLQSTEDLKDATTQNGKPLFDPNNMPSDDDSKQGLSYLKSPHGAYFSLLDELMDGWQWVKEKTEDAIDWVFVMRIAGEVFEFILDCVEKVGEALTWVWNKIKVGIETLIEYLGFLFDWGDILDTKDQVSALITAGCDLAATKVGSTADSLEIFFSGLLAKVDGCIETTKNITASPNSGSNNNNSPVFNDTNGGMGSSLATWDQIFAPALSDVEDAITKVGDDIKELWHKSGSMSTSDLMTLCKDILKAVSFQKVLQLISEYCNKTISIPIFSALYKVIAKHDLAAFDAIALIIAVPTTIPRKVIAGSAPPKIPNLDGKLLDALVFGSSSGGVTVTPQMQLDFNTLTAGRTHRISYSPTEGTAGALEVLTGSTFLKLLSIVLDMCSTLNSFPSDSSLSGYLSLIRGGSHILATFVPLAGPQKEAKGKLLLILDLAVTLVNFGLYQAFESAEIDAAKSWPDYDGGSAVVGIEGSVLNVISGIGYFVAFMFKEEVEVSGVGLAIMEGATLGLAAVEGIKWKIDYDRGKKSLMTPSSASSGPWVFSYDSPDIL
ncbi:hypothetical protein M501DRAFT_1007694 [Patellaria atrata CBS 101060]|uniref:Uncharacterized protein n=1 Tax=Patellaria atrata CBS 101060 TaxID=1346257 RepID=A0A9P4VN34_9PEZI|nr:hypothetical protein M501DRAFT_1007694 [Patellaria atrata CBS 101060]